MKRKITAALSAATMAAILVTPLPARANACSSTAGAGIDAINSLVGLFSNATNQQVFISESDRQQVQVFCDGAGEVLGDIQNAVNDISGAFDILGDLQEIFPSLSTFATGVDTILNDLSNLLPPQLLGAFGNEDNPTPFGIPDIATLEGILSDRGANSVFTIDDIVLTGGIEGDNRFSDSTELLLSQALATYAKGVGKAAISAEGQKASEDTVQQVLQNYQEIARSAVAISELDAAAQNATTTFDRVGIESQQRREAARQAQMSAMNDATLLASIQKAQTIAAKNLILDSQDSLAQLGRDAAEARDAAADDFVRRTAALYLTTPGGTPPDETNELLNYVTDRLNN